MWRRADFSAVRCSVGVVLGEASVLHVSFAGAIFESFVEFLGLLGPLNLRVLLIAWAESACRVASRPLSRPSTVTCKPLADSRDSGSALTKSGRSLAVHNDHKSRTLSCPTLATTVPSFLCFKASAEASTVQDMAERTGMPLLSGAAPPHNTTRADISCRKCNKEFNIIFTRARRCNHCGELRLGRGGCGLTFCRLFVLLLLFGLPGTHATGRI